MKLSKIYERLGETHTTNDDLKLITGVQCLTDTHIIFSSSHCTSSIIKTKPYIVSIPTSQHQ